MYIASLLSRVLGWCTRPTPSAAEAVLANPAPTPIAVAPNQIESPLRRKSLDQRHPTLWEAKCSDPKLKKMWCGPTAVAAIIGADVAAVCAAIKSYRKNNRPVMRTYHHELQHAFRTFGCDMTLVADFSANPPTFAAWERARTDMETAYVVAVTDHWVAVRGNWFNDTYTFGQPVHVKRAPHRRRRVRFVYSVT